MILFSILAVIAAIIIGGILLVTGVVAGSFAIVFGDAIICVLLIVGIVKLVKHFKKKGS